MAERITISNETLSVTISTKGAELKSIRKGNDEFLWDGNPNVWSEQSPLLFPICGGLRDDKFIFKGKEYLLEKHGYGRKREFSVEEITANSVIFLHCSDKESTECFPFEYELRVCYELIDNKVSVKYSVKNTGNDDMYFSIGAHEGYACPEGIEEYTLVFEKEENMTVNDLDGNLLKYDTYSVGENTKELPLKYKFFEIDALTFLNLKSKSVSLKHNLTGKAIRVEFDGFPYLCIWTKPNANYVCIEPWCGIPDFVDSEYDLTKKKGIIWLKAQETEERIHNIYL